MAAVRPYEYARELIVRFGLDAVPVDVEALAGKLGLTITYFDNPKKADPEYHKTFVTACAWLDKEKKAMWVYKNMPVTRQRLSIAHEIMHFLNPYHECISPFAGCESSPYFNHKPQERQAYEGALWLLFLCDRFTDRIKREKPGLNLVSRLAHEHGVSQEATAMWYVHANQRPCALVVAEPPRGITREQEEAMFDLAEAGTPEMPPEVTLNSGKKIQLKPFALRVKYAVRSDSFKKRMFAAGKGIPFDSGLCYAYRSGDLFSGPVSVADLGIGRGTETYDCECARFGTPEERKVMALAWTDDHQQELF